MAKYKTLENYAYAGISFTLGHIIDDEIDKRLTDTVVSDLIGMKIIESVDAPQQQAPKARRARV